MLPACCDSVAFGKGACPAAHPPLTCCGCPVPSTLADLPDGSRARVVSVTGDRAWRRRLLELGFVPDTELRVVRRVPVGDVLEVELRFSRVSLRISEASALAVEPLP